MEVFVRALADAAAIVEELGHVLRGHAATPIHKDILQGAESDLDFACSQDTFRRFHDVIASVIALMRRCSLGGKAAQAGEPKSLGLQRRFQDQVVAPRSAHRSVD